MRKIQKRKALELTGTLHEMHMDSKTAPKEGDGAGIGADGAMSGRGPSSGEFY